MTADELRLPGHIIGLRRLLIGIRVRAAAANAGVIPDWPARGRRQHLKQQGHAFPDQVTAHEAQEAQHEAHRLMPLLPSGRVARQRRHALDGSRRVVIA